VDTLGIGWLQLLSHCITSRGVIRNARLSAAVKLVGVCLQQMLRLGDDAARELEQQAKTALHFHFALQQLQPTGSREAQWGTVRGAW
jgi:hypothetical protein